MKITREVRFNLTQLEERGPILNSWAGWPSSEGLGPYVNLRVTVAGEVDSDTGYLCNIKTIDTAVREEAIPRLRDRWRTSTSGCPPCETLLSEVRTLLRERLAGLDALSIHVTPFLYHAMNGEGPMVTVTQSFEFSAAHRLYSKRLSDEENFRVFGKCANPNGHGHNYVLEVTVGGTPDESTGAIIKLEHLERTVKERVVDVFDHKNLNVDCEEFADLNPSAENIARVIWDKLKPAFDTVDLKSVRLYETPKTCAEYGGE